jgi:hypothetical protein
MVNRIFLHANKYDSRNEQRHNSANKHQKIRLSAVVAVIAFVYSTVPSSANLLIAVKVLGVLLLSIKYLLGFIRRNQFQKAVIEITPFGVQLISIYGPGSSSSHGGIQHKNSRGQSTLSYSVTDTSSRSHNNIDNTHHVHHGKSSLHKTVTTKRKVRAFIPREQILDVIVMEIVWPHCVWSQVAFRVDKGLCKSSPVVQSQHSEYEAQSSVNKDDHRERRQHQPISSKGDAYNGDIVTINGDEDYYASRSHNIHALFKQNRVAIVPAFPEECRGLLSYKECLLLQEEIERLLGNIDS